MYKLGLIGNPLSHSFSKKYFDIKFKNEKLSNFTYELYELEDLKKINELIEREKLVGINVTQPYKHKIIKYLNDLDDVSMRTQSVNTVFINPKTKKKIGFNTDAIGFEKLLLQYDIKNKTSLILGSGGVSKTISYVLENHNIKHKIVSRNPTNNMISYIEAESLMRNCNLIINTTPLGQYPKIHLFPNIPYNFLSSKHICIDLIYNPEKSIFLKKAHSQKAQIINGKKMLIEQAKKSWEIWGEMIKKYNV